MIHNVMLFLRNHLNSYLSVYAGGNLDESGEDKVVFLDGEQLDPVRFKLNAVSVLLINVEEDATLRAPDLYSRVSPNGARQQVQPEIKMNLYALFVARFKQYEDALRYLSLIIQHFQRNRVLTHQNAPQLSDEIEQLVMELKTLSFAEQNEIWTALRTTYHPCVLYKVKMVVFRDEDTFQAPEVEERSIRTTS